VQAELEERRGKIMVKKIFTYRGHTLDDLKEMSIEEFAKILPSRLRRHLKRGLTESEKILIKKVEARGDKSEQKPIKTHVRNMIILPKFVGIRFMIYNGKDWNIVEITEEMIGHRLGEFSKTRKMIKHSGPGIGATRGTKFASVK